MTPIEKIIAAVIHEGWYDQRLGAEAVAGRVLQALREAGYVIAPLEPSDAMCSAGAYGSDSLSQYGAAQVWADMVEAAETSR